MISVGDKVQYRGKNHRDVRPLGRGIHTVHAIEVGPLRSKIAVIRLADGTDYRIRCAYLSRCASHVFAPGDQVRDLLRPYLTQPLTVHSVADHQDGRQRIRFSTFDRPKLAERYRSICVDDDTLPLHDVPADENNSKENSMNDTDTPSFAEKLEANLRAEAECMLEADRLLARQRRVLPTHRRRRDQV